MASTPPRHYPGPSNHHEVVPDALSSPLIPFIPLDDWCKQMGLGENELAGLEKLHFRAGDDLSGLR